MRRLPALVAAMLLPVAQPLILGTAFTTGGLFVFQAPAQAQSAEAVAKVAQAITVRIEGATQGSGVLVKRDGNRYTVLTAWHVVSWQRSGEELDIFTPDGQRHKLEQGSIKRMGEVDMAMLSFTSLNTYEVAQIGDPTSVSMGSTVYVGGFPLPSSAVPSRLMRFLKGDVIANATVAIPNGYQLLYSNPTLPGMSGGAVINAQGQLVGIHGQGETDSTMSEQKGVAVKTGTNQAVPITYCSKYCTGILVDRSSTQAVTADDYLVQAQVLFDNNGDYREIIGLANKVLAQKENPEAYFYRAYARNNLFDFKGAQADYQRVIGLKKHDARSYYIRGLAQYIFGRPRFAIPDLNQTIAMNPQNSMAYYWRGAARFMTGDIQGSIFDLSQSIAINPQYSYAYVERSIALRSNGNVQKAIVDLNQAIAINPRNSYAYYVLGETKRHYLDDMQGACDAFRASASLGSQMASALLKADCQNSDCRPACIKH